MSKGRQPTRRPPRRAEQANRRATAAAQVEQRCRAQRRLVVATVVAALVVAGGVGYLSQTRGPAAGGDSAATLDPAEHPETGVVHVHGLGVDPGDGTLYAATHSGLFEVPEDGRARRIANRYQDTMGFTIAGPGTFLGSGHPDLREDDVRPPLLGLIESTDKGQTWKRLSLHGKADFHALHARHGLVYGYDSTSGTFMVSRDKLSWDRRAQLPMRDFAVSPSDADVVLATTSRGLARSADGGRSWAGVNGAPTLAILSWATPDSLYGVDPAGKVHHSGDGGATWTARGNAGGEPEAITVDSRGGSEVLYVAATERGILTSRDGGRTFTVRYTDS